MTRACEPCLRRAHLVALLAPRIAALLDRSASRVPGLLSLTDDELIGATTRGRRAEAEEFLERFDAEEARAALEKVRAFAVCRHDDGYPVRLRPLTDAPAVVFGIGEPARLRAVGAEPAVAIVGTRQPTPYGSEVARALGRGLGAAGVTVVSGLALGIDGEAHRGCLDGDGMPVAVLAGGPDIPYPRRHRDLHSRVRSAGLVLSEMPPRAPAFRWSFPARNRIMAGLADITVVVEATEPSGSLITSDFARELGRAVAAVPGRITSRMATGTNSLLRDGATPVTSAEDVLDELFGVGIRPPGWSPERAVSGPPEPDDPVLRGVLEAVADGRPLSDVAERFALSLPAARAAVGRLEADGYLVRRMLGGWERVAG